MLPTSPYGAKVYTSFARMAFARFARFNPDTDEPAHPHQCRTPEIIPRSKEDTMDYKAIQASNLEAIITLPEELRSEQCYNDIQHSMLVILFRHAMKAIRAGNRVYTDLLMDNITIYLYIHFLAEEEGMVFSMSKGIYDRDVIAAHTGLHITFLDFWMDNIYKPHKTGQMPWSSHYSALDNYYGMLIKHIDDQDQSTYGTKLVHDDKNHRAESAFVARSNIPLSPLMVGAVETVRILNPEAAKLLNTDKLSDMAMRPLPKMNLIELDKPLIQGGRPCLRDRFHARMGETSYPAMRKAG